MTNTIEKNNSVESTEKSIVDFLDKKINITIEKNGEGFIIKSNGLEVKHESETVLKSILRKLFQEKSGRVTTGYNWTGDFNKLDLLKQIMNCGFKYQGHYVKEVAKAKEDISNAEIKSQLVDYRLIYKYAYKLYNYLPEKVSLKKEVTEKLRVFSVLNEKGETVFQFSRNNYLNTFPGRLERHLSKKAKDERKAEKEKIKIADKIKKLKEAGFLKEDLLAMFTD